MGIKSWTEKKSIREALRKRDPDTSGNGCAIERTGYR